MIDAGFNHQGSLPFDNRTVPPVAVSYGGGVDSSGMLVQAALAGSHVDHILFANVGNEKSETMRYIEMFDRWCQANGLPGITEVKAARPRSGDRSLGDALLRTRVLPALAFNRHQCSIVWKIDPQERFLKKLYGWDNSQQTWVGGFPFIERWIGYDASPRDQARARSAHGKASSGFVNAFPLIEGGMTREGCQDIIKSVGLPVPPKSSCTFCPAMKKEEINDLARTEPEKLREALLIERGAQERGLRSIVGLGRSWSWRDYVLNQAPADVRTIAQSLC